MQIDDAELRNVFRSSSLEELDAMRAGLDYLDESGAVEGEAIELMLRKAHSMKGSAGMLELKDIASLARQWEVLIKQVVAEKLTLSPPVLATLHQALDAIAALVNEAVTGEPSGVQTFYVLAQLMNPDRVIPALAAVPESSEPSELSPSVELPGSPESLVEVNEVTAVIASELKTEPDQSLVSDPPQQSAELPTPQVLQPTRPKFDADLANFIEDEELRDTFRIASDEHLENLDRGLLHLEQYPNDGGQLDAILREIHSIKGDSGMLGVEALVPLAHTWEQQLIPVKNGEVTLTSELCDRLALGLERIRALVRQATDAIPAHVDVAMAIVELENRPARTDAKTVRLADDRAAMPPSDDETATETTDLALPAAPVNVGVEETKAAPPDLVEEMTRQALGRSSVQDGNYRIDTIRVATRNLDALMNQAGELMVAKSRIAHRMVEIDAIAARCEHLNREALSNRFVWDTLRNLNLSKEEEAVLHKIQSYHQTIEQQVEALASKVEQLQVAVGEDTSRLENVASNLEEGIQTLRLLPLSTIFNLYPRMVRDLGRSQDKQINFVIEGEDTLADKRVLEEMKDPLMHIIRNAIDHGIEPPAERLRQGKSPTAMLRLRGYQSANSIVIEVSDDGRGLNLEKIKQTALKHNICRAEELATMTPSQIQALIFIPGFSTRSFVTEVSGRGVGLDVVRENVERLKGNITIDSQPQRGCTMHIELGSMLSTTHVLLVEVNQMPYALPVEYVRSTNTIEPKDIFLMENRKTILVDDVPISLVHLSDLLQLPSATGQHEQRYLSCVILKVDGELLAIVVDRLIDQQDVLLKPQSRLLQRVRNVSGATILGTGEICMVLHPPDLVESVRGTMTATIASVEPRNVKQRILLAEDSIATRTQEKRILEAAGYEVVPAVDGLDAFNKLRGQDFDAIVSDVQMPNLDGLQLTARVRQNSHYAELPIVLVTSLATDDDRRRGAEAGANAYITKSSFNQDVLIETLRRFI